MKRKTVLLITCTLLLAILLSACGNSDTYKDDKGNTLKLKFNDDDRLAVTLITADGDEITNNTLKTLLEPDTYITRFTGGETYFIIIHDEKTVEVAIYIGSDILEIEGYFRM